VRPERTSHRDLLRVSICAPDLHGPGGVAAHCLAVRDSLTVAAEFFTVGRRPHRKLRLFQPLRALRDFFQHGKMGFLVDRADPELISDFIHTLIQNRALAQRMSRYNRRYARDRFAAPRVAGRLEEIYRRVGSDT